MLVVAAIEVVVAFGLLGCWHGIRTYEKQQEHIINQNRIKECNYKALMKNYICACSEKAELQKELLECKRHLSERRKNVENS